MRNRALVSSMMILFVLSWIFPIGAGLVKNPTSLPRWWGTVDVVLAFVIAISVLWTPKLAHGKVDKAVELPAYRIYRSSMHVLLAVAVLVMAAGDRIVWAQCATGFLWRSWLFLYIVPWWLAAVRRPRSGRMTGWAADTE